MYPFSALFVFVVVSQLLPSIQVLGWSKAHDDALLTFATEKGAQLNVEVGHNAQGIRGLFAARDIRKGELLAMIPAALSITLGTSFDTGPELATMLLREVHRSRRRFGPYLDTLPQPGEQLCAEALPQDLLHLLQDQSLEGLVAAKQAWLQQVWSGSAPNLRLPMDRAIGGRNISLEAAAWATCMVSSRSIEGPKRHMYLIPVLDLANHRPTSPHTLVFNASEEHGMTFSLVAGEDVASGQEVRIDYGGLRNDEALLYYGFLMRDAGPTLALCDEPGFTAQHLQGARRGVWDVPRVEGPVEQVQSEIERLEGRLARLQTALSQEAAAAAGGQDPGPDQGATAGSNNGSSDNSSSDGMDDGSGHLRQLAKQELLELLTLRSMGIRLELARLHRILHKHESDRRYLPQGQQQQQGGPEGSNPARHTEL